MLNVLMKLVHFNPKLFGGWLALCGLGGGLISCLSVLPFWGGAVIVAAALVINSVVAEIEDSP
ncbi:MAG: hypothetical protein PXX73_04240 [Sideroxydans sp.]|nr:hypothetical protein [Sideroxydans sp.]